MTKVQKWVAVAIIILVIALVTINIKAQIGPVAETKPLSANGQKLLKGYQARFQILQMEMSQLTDDLNQLQKDELAAAKVEAKDGWGLNWQGAQLERHAVPQAAPAAPTTPPKK